MHTKSGSLLFLYRNACSNSSTACNIHGHDQRSLHPKGRAGSTRLLARVWRPEGLSTRMRDTIRAPSASERVVLRGARVAVTPRRRLGLGSAPPIPSRRRPQEHQHQIPSALNRSRKRHTAHTRKESYAERLEQGRPRSPDGPLPATAPVLTTRTEHERAASRVLRTAWARCSVRICHPYCSEISSSWGYCLDSSTLQFRRGWLAAGIDFLGVEAAEQ